MTLINFTVNYDQLATQTDSSDTGADSDIISLIGDVTFTPTLVDDRPALATSYTPRPAGIKLRPITGYIDSDGQLKSARSGSVGVRLPANDPVLNLSRLQYQVTFNLRTPLGEKVRVDPGYFDAPSSDTTVNLVNVLQPTGVTSFGIIGSAGITPTAVKTGSYTAVSGDLVIADASSAGFTVTLPNAPAIQGTRIAVKKIDSSANVVTVACSGSDVLNKTGGSTSIALRLTNQAATFQYQAGIWYVVNDDLPLTQLDARYLTVFDARTYGVIADGAQHNNVANLLDCMAQCAAAGGGIVQLPAGVILTSEATLGTVTADSGRTYTNNGGLPLPVNTPMIIQGHGGATVLRLSAGLPRAFDFWRPVTGGDGQVYRNIQIRDMTVDRNNLKAADLVSSITLSSALSVPASGTVTVPGVNGAAWRNVRIANLIKTGATYTKGMADSAHYLVSVSGSTLQIIGNGTAISLSSGDKIVPMLSDHVILGDAYAFGYLNNGLNMTIDNVLVENVDAVNVYSWTPPSAGTGPFTVPMSDACSGISISIDQSGSYASSVTNFTARKVRVFGGANGITVSGSPRTFLDQIWFEDCFHDTLVDPTSNYYSSNFLIGGYAWVHRCGMTRCHGRRSGDVACEFDQPWEAYETDCLWEDAYANTFFRGMLAAPAKTASGPPTTTLAASLTSSATTITVASMPTTVASSGLALIDSELVYYQSNNSTSWTIWRGINTTAATHNSGATVTFVETNKTRVISRGQQVRATAPAGTTPGILNTYLSSLGIPSTPLTMRDPTWNLNGGNWKAGNALYWTSFEHEIDIQGLRYTHTNLTRLSTDTVIYGSAIGWGWTNGYATYAKGTPMPAPKLYGRNNKFYISGDMSQPFTIPVYSASGNNTTVTMLFNSSPGVGVGETITVSGMTPSSYNGTYVVTGVGLDVASGKQKLTYNNSTTTASTVSGTVTVNPNYSIMRPIDGMWMQLDFDFSAYIDMTGNTAGSVRFADLSQFSGATTWLAPQSRLGIEAKTSPSTVAPVALNVGVPYPMIGGIGLTISDHLDVDLDVTGMRFTADSTDSNYRPWQIDPNQAGRVKFGTVRHSATAVGGYPNSGRNTPTAVSTDYAVKADDQVILVNSLSRPVNITLPQISGGNLKVGEPLTRGRQLTIIDAGLSAATNTITVTPQAGDAIDTGTAGAATTITTNGGRKTLYCYSGNGPNLISDAGFESSASWPSGWVSTDIARTGSSSMKVTGTAGFITQILQRTGTNGATTVTTTVTAGTVYYGEIWMYGKTGNNGAGTVQFIAAFTDSSAVMSKYSINLTPNSTPGYAPVIGSWIKLSGYVVVPNGYDRMQVSLQINNSVPSGDVLYFDDITLCQVNGKFGWISV